MMTVLAPMRAQVQQSLFQQVWRFLEHAKTHVAGMAQQAAYFAGGVIVIDSQTDQTPVNYFALWGATHSATTTLPVVQCFVFLWSNAELLFQFRAPPLFRGGNTESAGVTRLASGWGLFGSQSAASFTDVHNKALRTPGLRTPVWVGGERAKRFRLLALCTRFLLHCLFLFRIGTLYYTICAIVKQAIVKSCHMNTDILFCACCGAPMHPDEAAPAPEGTPDTLLYHAQFRDCVRVALAHLGETTPVMRAYLGAEETSR